MSGLFSEAAKKQFAAAIAKIEAQTSAEIVVTVRRQSAGYRRSEFAMGTVFGAVALLVYVYAPITFKDDIAPLIIAVAYGAGALVPRIVPRARRLFTTEKGRRAEVAKAARAAFLEQRIDCTARRTGVLVFVSLLERWIEVVCDRGVPTSLLPEWEQTIESLRATLRRGGAETLPSELARLGPLLEAQLPVRADDVDELPNEVVS